MIKTWLFILGYAFSIVSATFTITEPSELQGWWANNPSEVHYSLGLIGDIPFGTQINGHIGLTTPLDACSESTLSGGYAPPILVAVRGNCKFHIKARNAQLAGAKILIIVNDNSDNVDLLLITDPPEEQELLHIATVLMKKEGGEKLIEAIKQAKKQNSFVSGVFDFPVATGFTIISPPQLEQWWTLNPDATNSSIANFGDIPWGSNIQGQIGLASPLDACTTFQVNNIAAGSTLPSIVLAERGTCPFATKARNAETAGVKLLLIVDNEYEDVESKLMIDTSGNREPVHIVTVLLTKKGGDKLLETVQEVRNQNILVSGIFNFAVSKQESVTYHLWLSNAQRESFEFLKDFKQYRDKLSPLTTPEIHFATTRANEASTANCICRDNRYCSPWAEGSLFKSGAEVILEDLRQLCIIKQFDLDTWWKYVLEFANSCLNSQNTADCSKSVVQKLGIDSSDIEFCMRGSFDQNDYQSCTYNSLLEQEDLAQSSDQLAIFLGVKINNFFYRGNLLPSKGVFSTICQAFQNMPEVCKTTLDTPSSSGPDFPDLPFPIDSNVSWPNVTNTSSFPNISGHTGIPQIDSALANLTSEKPFEPTESGTSTTGSGSVHGEDSPGGDAVTEAKTTEKTDNGSSSHTVLLIVCVVIFVLVVLFFYRRSVKRLATTASQQAGIEVKGKGSNYAVLGENLPPEEEGNASNSVYKV